MRNVRADPTVTLSHGSKTRQARLEEVGGRLGASVVAAYHARESFSRPYMDVPEDPTVEDFESKAGDVPGVQGRLGSLTDPSPARSL